VKLLGRRDARRPVGRLADDRDVGLHVEEAAQALADHGMVVHHEHADL
jgi:hypothetical protein